MGKLQEALKNHPVLILDGALGTELEYQGHDVSGKLWSAKYLLGQSDIIQKVHEEYVLAGSDLITTSSYQASVPGLAEEGLSETEAEKILASTVSIVQKAVKIAWESLSDRERRYRIYPLVGGSIGPYAAYLADGSEYTGIYQVVENELLDFHQTRIEALLEAGADFLAIETIPNCLEAKVLTELLSQYPQIDAYISFTSQDGQTISDGTPIEEVVALCENVANLVAVGINCTAPHHVESLLKKMRAVTKKPFIVYPNSGEIYDGVKKTWHDNPNDLLRLPDYSRVWKEYGVKIFGGCCRTRPADIVALRQVLIKE